MPRSSRELRRARERRGRARALLLWGGLGIAALAVLLLLVWNGAQPLAGVAIPVEGADHVEDGTDPGPYNSNPPTSGTHFPSTFDAGFYDEQDAAAGPPYPQGYLVHNLEHGYVIFWYNCALLEPAACDEMKAQIQGVMEEFGNFKLIAFPWNSIDVPVVLTSWGQMQEMERFDASQARRFIRRNLNEAPEPEAD
jgi:hypothetical protein